jgi:ferritin-like metal-binding protein YciE
MAKTLATLRDLYVYELRDLYSAETQLVKALPKMAKAATSRELKNAFEDHLQATERQVERLDRIFEKLGEKPRGRKCVAMEGLIEEGKELINGNADDDVRDAGLIAAAQKVEHYEIAGYGTCRTYARTMGDEEAAELLQETLDEEGEADKLLTSLAETITNPRAAANASDR